MRNKFFPLLLCAAACPMLQAQITLDRSEVQINLKYNGQPASQAAPGFYFNISFGSYGAGMFYDSTVFTDIIPANYTVDVRFPGSASVLASFPIVASGGARVTLDIELSGFAGIYRGTYLQNGLPGSAVSCPSSGSGCIGTNGSGVFAHIVAAGAGTGYLRGNQGIFQNYNYTVVAGQTVDIGTFNRTVGSVTINLKYNGQPATQAAPGFYFNVSFGSYGAGMFYDSTTISEVPLGGYTVQITMPGNPIVLGTYPLTVNIGQNTVDIELSGFAGIYRGTYLQNGLPGSAVSCPSSGSGCIGTNGSGVFAHIVAAGAGTGYLRGNQGIFQNYNYTVVAGQTVDIGTFNRTVGSVTINLKYNGQPATQAASGFYFNVSFGSYGAGMFYDSTTISEVPLGSYTAQVSAPGYPGVLATYPLTVGVGQNTLDVDLCPFAGVVRGTLLVNGQPGTGYISCPSSGSGCIGVGAGGVFAHIVPAGPGTGYIRGPNGLAWNYSFKAVSCTQSAIGDPTALNVLAKRDSTTTTLPVKTWAIRITNLGAGTWGLNMTDFKVTRNTGPMCTPVVNTPLPIPLGTLSPTSSVVKNIAIDFTGCSPTTKFRMDITVNNGTNTTVLPPQYLFY